MSSTNNIQPDCTEQCKSTKHGDIITAALTKRSVTDTDLCAYLNYVCSNCELVRDSHGRTALHVAASCGRNGVIKWLVNCRRANINLRDEESGYTALHRSVFYGKIDTAVQLIKLGADTSIHDSNSLLALEHALKDNIKPDPIITSGELYVWGSNVNNSLGPATKNLPELFDVFHKEYPHESVQQICIEQFHSVIVSSSGKVYSCGHGQGGRLGLGVQYTVVSPKLVTFPENNNQNELLYCTQASISRDHSLFLMSDGSIYVCGLNTHKVLGVNPPPPHVLTPKIVKYNFKELKGVRTGRFHSVAWGEKCLYSWGLNAGQLGHKQSSEDKYIVTPKFVGLFNLSEAKIRAVSTSDCATAVCTDRGDIYVLHEYQCRKIASRQLNVIQLSVIGGKLNALLDDEIRNEAAKELKVIALTINGTLLLWQESDPQLCRCIFSICREIIVKQVVINYNEVLFVTNEGEAFQGLIKPRKKRNSTTEKHGEKSAFHEFLEKEFCIVLKLAKFPKIHRAICIESNSKGTDYCVIQGFPYKLYDLPDVEESQIEENFGTLHAEASEFDDVHDVVFKINSRLFPCHKYIVLQRCPEFETVLSDCNKIVDLKGTNPDLFEQMLLYIYTNTCDLLQTGPCPQNLRNLTNLSGENKTKENCEEVDIDKSAFEVYKSKSKRSKPESNEAPKNVVRMLHELAKKFGYTELQKEISNYDIIKNEIREKTNVQYHAKKPFKFNRAQLAELYDVTIICKDNLKIKAHKCVLAARLDYFNNMFSLRWNGCNTSEVNLPFPKGVTETLVDFLYTDTLSCLDNQDTDHLFKVLVLADQLFVTRLKEQCELQLSQLLTLKNAVQLLNFACTYNANKLKTCALDFIVRNMPAFLESRSMDDLEDEILTELNEFYYKIIGAISCRIITPYSGAVLDEEIISVGEKYPVDFETRTPVKVVPKRRTRTAHKTSISDNSNVKTCERTCSISDDSFVQFPDEETVQSSSISERVRAITLAESKVKNETIEQKFTPLKSGSDSFNLAQSPQDFPELNSPPINHSKPALKYNCDNKHAKIVKLSQKQRKRLSSESNNNVKDVAVTGSPKNPWKIVPDLSSPVVSPEARRFNMSDIIMDEKKQKENLVKIKSKLLFHTQIEDRAILELHKFYNTEEIGDELITIERVDIGTIASPVWVPKSTKIL